MHRSVPLNVAILLSGALLVGCSLGGPLAPTEAPTLSSEEVLATAQSIAEATRNASSPTPSSVAATATATDVPPTETPTATATPESPVVIADYNANVRSGPGEAFDAIDYLLEGDRANAAGQFLNDESGTWYFVRRIETGRDGWIWAGAVTLSGNPNLIPFIDSPPTPTPGPSPTPTEEPD